MPFSKFDSLKTPSDLTSFFATEFPDALPLIPDLVEDYFRNPKGSLVMSKCFPFNYKGKCLVIGDAAHAMVPFYGQGMNCGMEDVDVLDSMLEFFLPGEEKGKRPDEGVVEKAFEEYSKKRYPDVSTMMDLALYNYGEMRHAVTDWRYLLRKKVGLTCLEVRLPRQLSLMTIWDPQVESYLHLLFPTKIIPLYTMVSFSQIPYSEVMRRWNAQTRMLETGAEIGIAAVVLGAAAVVAKLAGLKVGVGAAVQGQERMWWFPWR
jgi:kynurenine 3-monooxygenase